MLWWMSQTSAVAAVLVALIVVASRLFRLSPAIRNALWLLVLVKLVTPPMFSIELPFLRIPNAQIAKKSDAVGESSHVHNPRLSVHEIPLAADAATPIDGSDEPVPKATVSRMAGTLVVEPTIFAPAPSRSREWDLKSIAFGLQFVWISGGLVAALWLGVRTVRLSKLLAESFPAPRWLRQQVSEVAGWFRVRPPPSHIVHGIASPFLWCWGCPKLFLPDALMDRLETKGRQAVIAHELAHLKRRDHWVRWLEIVALLVWWWNPLFWVVRRGLRDSAEQACDAWVIVSLPGERRSYAEALIEVSRSMSGIQGPLPALGMAGSGRKSFEGRLAMIMQDGVKSRLSAGTMLLLGILALVVLPSWAPAQKDDEKSVEKAVETKSPANDAALAMSLQRARCDGKYAMLLRQIHVPDDASMYGEFRDFGRFSGTSYAGQDDLPQGFWVYVEPYWYIWRDESAKPKMLRRWGPEQACGKPDTDEAGDRPTAWASLTQDGQDEWLLLEFETPVVPKEVHVHETYNPGALNRVTAFQLDGTEVEVWKGQDPTSPGEEKGVSKIKIAKPFRTNRVKIHLSSREIEGWNEIDAVGLVDADGKTQWAIAADASSTFGVSTAPLMPRMPVAQGKLPWSPEQVVGPPDTTGAGDFQAAWASLTEDGQDEWLQVDYASEISPVAVMVYENYNPGALNRVTAFRADGSEVEIWQGKDPTRPGGGSGVSVIPVQTDFKTTRIKIYLASKEVTGWNEIDAIGLRDEAGKVHWAKSATASSTYARQTRGFDGLFLPEAMPEINAQRLMVLEMENKELKRQLVELKSMTLKGNSDADFVNQMYLDLTGKKPNDLQIEAFKKDSAKDKRVSLIKSLLEKPARPK